MASLLETAGYNDVKIRRDLNNRDRFATAIKNG
jgi:hypothetical protein